MKNEEFINRFNGDKFEGSLDNYRLSIKIYFNSAETMSQRYNEI